MPIDVSVGWKYMRRDGTIGEVTKEMAENAEKDGLDIAEIVSGKPLPDLKYMSKTHMRNKIDHLKELLSSLDPSKRLDISHKFFALRSWMVGIPPMADELLRKFVDDWDPDFLAHEIANTDMIISVQQNVRNCPIVYLAIVKAIGAQPREL